MRGEKSSQIGLGRWEKKEEEIPSSQQLLELLSPSLFFCLDRQTDGENRETKFFFFGKKERTEKKISGKDHGVEILLVEGARAALDRATATCPASVPNAKTSLVSLALLLLLREDRASLDHHRQRVLQRRPRPRRRRLQRHPLLLRRQRLRRGQAAGDILRRLRKVGRISCMKVR